MDEAFNHEFLPLGELKTLLFQVERIRENLLTYNDDFVKYEKLRQEKKKKTKKKSALSMNSTASFASSNFIDDPFMFSRENILMRTPEEVGDLIVLLWKYALRKYRTPISAQQIDSVTNDLKQCMVKMGINGEVFLEMKEVSDWNFFFAKELVKYLDMTELFSVIVYDFMPTKKE
ncbi:hypothetical protein NAEGRDRAFT_78169 [Naegleria gruberi]|uniref:Uncharacterized protein n=1 Tax=Naegleria gruberi TaxID=5762 RepID=D2V1R4_NAEGR|nr:uncharacterized protein NAEGRDRAFT_78169 [Naegleria gruberi]EFC49207.1 hypothetical protein NAEGRDRAFT_78169 [Naegleria gruberi]|eukprot:XP_002681951.1 hypothetical protein NAEGRDRAFT_78169 [Naegleria gruberi strain NEG-M]